MLEFINSRIIGAILPPALLCCGIFFIVYLRGLPLIRPRAVLAPFLRRGSGCAGELSPRSALWLALGGVLGVGNIVGVASAVFLGGAGAVFWMCLSALAASVLKYAETVLALSRRKGQGASTTADYIKASLTERKHPRLGAFFGVGFALLCLINSLSLGCVVQVNAIAGVCEDIPGIPPIITGALCAVLIITVSSGGLKSIAKATNAIVPFMSAIFLLLSVAALVIRADRIPQAAASILTSAFDFKRESIFGGVGGFFLSESVRMGVLRGLISNEAGAGTSPMAHSAAASESPAEQGALGVIEVFADTVLLCTLTALVILVSYPEVEGYGDNSVMMTVSAYSSALGEWVRPVMCALVLLFGMATVFCQCFYGQACLSYLTSSGVARHILTIAYGAAAITAVRTPPGSVWGLADLSIGIMTLINLAILMLEKRRIRSETFRYFIS